MLTLTQLKTDFAVWEGGEFIGKRGSSKSVAWLIDEIISSIFKII